MVTSWYYVKVAKKMTQLNHTFQWSELSNYQMTLQELNCKFSAFSICKDDLARITNRKNKIIGGLFNYENPLNSASRYL